MENAFTFVIVGGGIAGVTCTELLSHLCPEEKILLISSSPLVKTAANVKQLTPCLEEFEIEEVSCESLLIDRPRLQVVTASVEKLEATAHVVHTSNGQCYKYKKLCIATGGKPKVIAKDNPRIIGIRDTETVQVFQEKLCAAKRVIVVGNGGIATELVYEIQGCEIIWAIKDSSISATFFDPGAAEFFVSQLTVDKTATNEPLKRHKYVISKQSASQDKILGSALGPDWAAGLDMKGNEQASRNVLVQYSCEIEAVLSREDLQREKWVAKTFDLQSTDDASWPLYVKLTNGYVFGCDFIVSATGVLPNTDHFLPGHSFNVAEDGGLKVDGQMRTNVEDIYAAGDVCSCSWEIAKHWFQMRLWTQARQQGAYCAKCMLAGLNGDNVIMDFCFELFTHVTRFFGYKVVLLGLFNGQKLGADYELILRMTKGLEYVKVVMQNGRMHGAILVGETDLEETFENLILNQMDLSRYGEDILDPRVDIEDYFD